MALVRGFKLSYHNKETLLSTIDPYYGDLTKIPETRTQPLDGEDQLRSIHIRAEGHTRLKATKGGVQHFSIQGTGFRPFKV